MNDTDIGDSYEWEREFSEWLRSKKNVEIKVNTQEFGLPQIKKDYSENFILQNFLDEN
jgi:hypothetical protein